MTIIYNAIGNYYTLVYTDKDGHRNYIDPFKTYNDALAHWHTIKETI